MNYKHGLMIFRRDLRLADNTALNHALKECATVIPCFIFDPRQIGEKNDYKSPNAIQFMIESLEDLSDAIKEKGGKLYLFHGKPEEVVAKLLKEMKIEAVYCNKDYTPFSIKRDQALEKECIKSGVAFKAYDDAMLNPPLSVLTGNKTPYSVFTPYWKRAREIEVHKPFTPRAMNFYQGSIKSADHALLKTLKPKNNPHIAVHGGTHEAKKILASLKKFADYAETHNFPALNTTHLSAHNKFGTVSIRQLYEALCKAVGPGHALIRQLYWRDFYMQVAYFAPYVYGQPFREKYKALQWSTDKQDFERWCTGTTGFPIVDAAMRQLNETGFMHNRCRMIVASFLTKDLHINWLWGEQYFAQQLVDYDPALNNGNWQWSASTGCDPQPYFRIFNPWLQQKKFDTDCIYIKRWIPELNNVDPKIIHNWYKETSPEIRNYPRPMLDHKKEAALAIAWYKKA